MAKRYFNIFKSHIVVLVTIIVLIMASEFTSGRVAAAAKIATGAVLIWAAISYAIWLIKAPTARVKEESL